MLRMHLRQPIASTVSARPNHPAVSWTLVETGGSVAVLRALFPYRIGEESPTKRPVCETWARMSHPDPNGPPDRRPIKVGEVWENPGDPGASLG